MVDPLATRFGTLLQFPLRMTKKTSTRMEVPRKAGRWSTGTITLLCSKACDSEGNKYVPGFQHCICMNSDACEHLHGVNLSYSALSAEGVTSTAMLRLVSLECA
jgi:hypothetical protein